MADDNIMIKRFFTYSELCLHNNVDDLWVAFLGRVYDLTPLSSEYRGNLFDILDQFLREIFVYTFSIISTLIMQKFLAKPKYR